MAKTNQKGKTWREHSAPYLAKALKAASKSWKPKHMRTNTAKLAKLRAQRDRINNEIKKEKGK